MNSRRWGSRAVIKGRSLLWLDGGGGGAVLTAWMLGALCGEPDSLQWSFLSVGAGFRVAY